MRAQPQELQDRAITVEVDDEAERFQQQVRLQAGHIGPIALPHVQDIDQGQRAHRLPQRPAGQAQVGSQIRLTWQPVPGPERP